VNFTFGCLKVRYRGAYLLNAPPPAPPLRGRGVVIWKSECYCKVIIAHHSCRRPSPLKGRHRGEYLLNAPPPAPPLRGRGVVKRKSECYCKVILHTTLAGGLLPLRGDTEGNIS